MAVSPGARADKMRVKLCPEGLDLGTEILPLVAGAMHYWRHDPRDWAACLDAMRAMGMKLVDTYVPWGVHELDKGVFDFGARDPRLDVGRFIDLIHERGMKCVLRPGPHINAELTYFGIPERVVWDRACQARSPQDNPVMLPMVPVGFPVPSYASEAFHHEVEGWLAACGRELAGRMWPEGPIVLLQVDNEGAMYFRDGPYDQDYHPDSLALFREFLRAKYKRPAALRAAWGGAEDTSFQTVMPPGRFDASTVEDVTRHLDWVEYHEHLLATAMERFADALWDAGLSGVPTMHNFPLGEGGTSLNAAKMSRSIDLVALDYYHAANPANHLVLMRRTTELASRAQGSGTPAYGAEVGAGFPPFFAPLDDKDSLYTLVAALAYGLRGYNLYMAVDRDRWVGAPIDVYGRPRKLADHYKALGAALDDAGFFSLQRRAPVRLVVPRVLRRLARATHALGPLTPALFNVLGAGFEVSCFEDVMSLIAIGDKNRTVAATNSNLHSSRSHAIVNITVVQRKRFLLRVCRH
jgi:beta-galactosidase